MKIIKQAFPIARLIFYISFLIFFSILDISQIPKSNCPTYTTFNYLCPSCGVTRAFTSIMHFDFAKALDFNIVFTLAIAPICLFIFFQDAYIIIKRMITKKYHKSIFEYYITDYLK